MEPAGRVRLEPRQQHGAREVSGADDTEHALPGAGGGGDVARNPEARSAFGRLRRIAQHDAEMRLGVLGDQPIGRLGFGEVEAVGDQLLDGEPAIPPPRHDGERVLEVARLGPAHEPRRVFHAAPFEVVVVAAGAVGARDDKRQLLLHELAVRNLGPGHADDTDARAIAGERRGGRERRAVLGRRGDQDAVAA
jgi:hypothetical protein